MSCRSPGMVLKQPNIHVDLCPPDERQLIDSRWEHRCRRCGVSATEKTVSLGQQVYFRLTTVGYELMANWQNTELLKWIPTSHERGMPERSSTKHTLRSGKQIYILPHSKCLSDVMTLSLPPFIFDTSENPNVSSARSAQEKPGLINHLELDILKEKGPTKQKMYGSNIVCNYSCSKAYGINCGVLQVSILGPLLF